MKWEEFEAAARSISWIAYLGTSDVEGNPHVSVVAPGFGERRLWAATRARSKKVRNLAVNPAVSFHWPVGGDGPGELIARGVARIHSDPEARDRIWDAGYMPYDLAAFFESKDNPDLVFLEAEIQRARLLGPDFQADVYQP